MPELISGAIGFMVGVATGMVANLATGALGLQARARRLRAREASLADEARAAQGYAFGPLQLSLAHWFDAADPNRKGWGFEDVEFSWSPVPKICDPRLQRHLDAVWEAQRTLNPRLYDGPRCGVMSIVAERPEPGGGRPRLKIALYPTTYRAFIGTNYSLDLYRQYFPFNARLFEPEGYRTLTDSWLSNDLATGTAVVTSDRRLLVMRRDLAQHVLANQFHASVAEGMHPERDRLRGVPNAFVTVVEGAREELGLCRQDELRIEDVEILAVGVYSPYAQPTLLCRARTSLSSEQVTRRFAESVRGSGRGDGELVVYDFSVAALAHLLLGTGVAADRPVLMADSGKDAILQALIQEYGKEHVLHELRRWLVGHSPTP